MLPEMDADLPVHDNEKLAKKVDQGALFVQLLDHPAVKLIRAEVDEFEERMKHKWAQLGDEELRRYRDSKLRHYAFLDIIKRKILEGQLALRLLQKQAAEANPSQQSAPPAPPDKEQ